MKLDLFLFIFALFLAFFAGNITYFIKSGDQAEFKDLDHIRRLHIELQEEVLPYKRLDLNTDYPTPERTKLLLDHPNITNTKRKITLNSSECLKSKITQLSSSFINKETLWLGYLCNQINKLPNNFFTSPPYIHSSGMSYSFMRFKMLSNPVKRVNWLEKHANFMHISEIKDLQWPISSNQRFLINSSQDVLKRIINGENTFLSDSFYFIKTGNLKYYVITESKAKRFFKRSRFDLSKDKTSCLFKIGNVCWNKKAHNLQSFLSQSSIVLFIGMIIILGFTANSLYNRLRRKKLEEERKKHALRILTHELRTPIASLLVQINEMNKSLDQLPIETQDPLLKIESQVYRLKHLAEKSQSYLQTDNEKLISLNPIKIESLSEFIKDLLFEYDEGLITVNAINDSSIFTDPYWLKMCLMNLIDNALRYGKPPVEIIINQKESAIEIAIKDHGDIPYINLKELLKAKHKNSKGLGIGLIIVNKTLKEMDAKLTLSTSPTVFKISFKKTRGNNE